MTPEHGGLFSEGGNEKGKASVYCAIVNKTGRRLRDLQPAPERAALEEVRIHDLRTLYYACLGA